MTEDKFREVYHQYYRLVKHVVYNVLNDINLAEDICQEVFLLFTRKEKTLDEKYYRQWFVVNAKRKSIDFCRRTYQIHEVTTEMISEENEFLEMSDKKSLEDKIAHQMILEEITGRLFQDLEKKNSDWYEIAMRLYVEGEEPEETARALGISIENLRTKKHRMKKWLNEKYKDELEDF